MSDELADLDSRRRSRFAWLGTALFFLVGALRAAHHEPWRDECGVWLLARNCPSLIELVRTLRYGGHPFLWPTLAWLLGQVTAEVFAFQVLHLLLASMAAFLVLRFAPWRHWETALCVFGYFFVFEYALICRGYVLGLLGACVVGTGWKARAGRTWLGGLGLFLLTQSSVFGLLLALAVLPALGVVAWGHIRSRTLTGAWCAGWLAPFFLGGALSVAMMSTPADAGFAPEWYWTLDAYRGAQVVGTAWRAFLPLPNLGTAFLWNSNCIDGQPLKVQALLGAGILLVASAALCRHRSAMLFFLCAVLGIGAFQYVKYPGVLRHHGHFYIAFLLAAWLAGGRERLPAQSWRFLARFRQGLLVVQLVAGLLLAAADWRAPFSANQIAAQWIASNAPANCVLAGHTAHAASGVGMHLRQPIYYLDARSWGTFMVWHNHRDYHLGQDECFRRAAVLGQQSSKPVLLILNKEFPGREGFRLMTRFTDSLIEDERFYIYARD